MAWWNPFERRSAPMETSRGSIMQVLFGGSHQSSTGIVVTVDNALTVPAVSAAVNFISETIASLPKELYRETRDGSREEVRNGLSRLLADAPNDYQSAYEFWKGLFVDKLTHGRGVAYIERNDSGTPVNLWRMDPVRTTVRRDGFVTSYQYQQPNGYRETYNAADVIDLPFMLMGDGFTARSPIVIGKEAIGLAIAATQYGSRFLANGGVPPFAVIGNFQSPAAAQRAADDFAAAVKKAAGEDRQALVLPVGLDIKQIGANPEDSQLVDLQRWCVEQIARLYMLPPTFLQDLTHGTYSNTEQQDLHVSKHTILHHVEQAEGELNLKLFGRRANSVCVEIEMDGLMRGDFTTRMEGWARAINCGLVTPNEARAAENYAAKPGGDQLMVQGATVPLIDAGRAAQSQTKGATA